MRPKVFELLVYLIQNRGKLIARETLLEELWKDTVVSEATLSRTIATLRDVLADNAQEPKYIETLQRRGYKFIAPVTDVSDAAPPVRQSGFLLIHGAQRYPLHEGDHFIGRGSDVGIPLYTPRTSRHHAALHISGSQIALEDLGSTNGTFVNGDRISGSIKLHAGDVIEIGGERLVLWSPLVKTIPG